jgi:hypothetical protein
MTKFCEVAHEVEVREALETETLKVVAETLDEVGTDSSRTKAQR